MSQFDWSITQKNETMETPQIEGFILKYGVPPLWPTFAKTYRMKMSCYGEHVGEHIGNLINILGTSREHSIDKITREWTFHIATHTSHFGGLIGFAFSPILLCPTKGQLWVTMMVEDGQNTFGTCGIMVSFYKLFD